MSFERLITFHVEPADRSVGIMAEGFSAWMTGLAAWCELSALPTKDEPARFTWYADATGDACTRPEFGGALLVEKTLLAFVEAWYEQEAQGETLNREAEEAEPWDDQDEQATKATRLSVLAHCTCATCGRVDEAPLSLLKTTDGRPARTCSACIEHCAGVEVWRDGPAPDGGPI